MAGSVNKVTLIGNLGRDPEVRSTQDGMKIVNLSLATSENWKDRNSGERRERTEWHRVVIFNENLARVAEQYLRKGSKIYVEGQLQTRKWTDQNGQDRYTTEVVLQRYRGELTMLDGPVAEAAAAVAAATMARSRLWWRRRRAMGGGEILSADPPTWMMKSLLNRLGPRLDVPIWPGRDLILTKTRLNGRNWRASTHARRNTTWPGYAPGPVACMRLRRANWGRSMDWMSSICNVISVSTA